VGAARSETAGPDLGVGSSRRPAPLATAAPTPVTVASGVLASPTPVAVASGSLASPALVAVLPVGCRAGATVSVTPTLPVAPWAPVTVTSLAATTLASAVPAIVVATASTSPGQLGGHQRLVATRPDDLEGLSPGSLGLAPEDRRDLDPVHELVNLDAQHVADRRSVWHQVPAYGSLRLPGAVGAPRPVAIVPSARQLDLHAWHGQER